MKRKQIIIDDGCNPELVAGADFDGVMEMPVIEAPKHMFIPKVIVPFSCRNRCENPANSAIGFFEHDKCFADVLQNPEAYIEEFLRFGAVISPDCSLYRNAPLAVQITNIYRNRAIGSYYQRKGVNVITLVRWGNELSFTTQYFPEKIAFLGVPKHTVLAVSPYGCIRSKEDKQVFKAGLTVMMETLEPKVVLVYGSMPAKIFAPFANQAKFFFYPDWTSRMRGGDR